MSKSKPDPWERQPGETAKAFGAFVAFRELGHLRRVGEVTDHHPLISRKSCYLWSAKYHWLARAGAWDQEQDRLRRRTEQATAKKMAERHAKIANAFLSKIVDRLKTLDADKIQAKDMPKWLEVATKLERLAIGEPTEITEARGQKDGESLDPAVLTDEELQEYDRLAKAYSDLDERVKARLANA